MWCAAVGGISSTLLYTRLCSRPFLLIGPAPTESRDETHSERRGGKKRRTQQNRERANWDFSLIFSKVDHIQFLWNDESWKLCDSLPRKHSSIQCGAWRLHAVSIWRFSWCVAFSLPLASPSKPNCTTFFFPPKKLIFVEFWQLRQQRRRKRFIGKL